MRTALFLSCIVITEALFCMSYPDSRDYPQSEALSSMVAVFMILFLVMDVYEIVKKYKK